MQIKKRPDYKADSIKIKENTDDQMEIITIVNTKNGRCLNRRDFIKATGSILAILGVIPIAVSCGGGGGDGDGGSSENINDTDLSREFTYTPADLAYLSTVVFSPDGAMIASRSRLNIKIWDASGNLLHTIYDSSSAGTYKDFLLSWSPDSLRLATDSGKILDASTGGEILTNGPQGSAVSWSSDGDKIVTGHLDGSLSVWDPDTGNVLLNIIGHDDRISSVFWSPDKSKIMSSSEDGYIKIWNATSGALALSIPVSTEKVYSAQWNPDGTKIASGSTDGMIYIWDSQTGTLLLSIESVGTYVHSVKWSPDGTKIAVGSNIDYGDNNCNLKPVQTFNASSGGLLFQVPYDISRVCYTVDWSPDGSQLVSGDHELIVIWSATNGSYMYFFQDSSLQELEATAYCNFPLEWMNECTCNLVCGCEPVCSIFRL